MTAVQFGVALLVVLVPVCAWLVLREMAASEARQSVLARKWGEVLDVRLTTLKDWLEAEATARREVPVPVVPALAETNGTIWTGPEGSRQRVVPGLMPESERVLAAAPGVRAIERFHAPAGAPREPQAVLILMDAHEAEEQGRMTVSARRRPRDVKYDDAVYVQAGRRETGEFVYRREGR